MPRLRFHYPIQTTTNRVSILVVSEDSDVIPAQYLMWWCARCSDL